MRSERPARGRLLVRPVETEETMPGGHIILTAKSRETLTAHQCEVVAVGSPALCHDPEDCERPQAAHAIDDEGMVHPSNVAVGDWLLVRPRCFVEGPEPERKEWYIHQDDVLAVLGR